MKAQSVKRKVPARISYAESFAGGQNYSVKLKITKALLFPVPRSPFSRGQALRGKDLRGQAFPLSYVIPTLLCHSRGSGNLLSGSPPARG
jgi:hypothetical protein